MTKRPLHHVLQVTYDTANDICRADFVDRNLTAPDQLQIREALSQVIAENNLPHLVIGFSNVDHASAQIFSILDKAQQAIRKKGGSLTLVNMEPQLMEGLEIAGYGNRLKTYETYNDAVAAIAGKSAAVIRT